MGEIQKFTEEHAEGVARLYLIAGRGEDRKPPRSLSEYVSQVHLNNPWASPDISSLVYLEKGKVIGAIGVIPRAMEFEGKPITLASVTLYLVDPEYRNGPAAIQLLRRVLKGPQDLAWTDGGSGHVSALWSAMGGHTASLYALNWIRILRPFGTARSGLDRIGGAGRLLKSFSGLLTIPADFLLSKAPLSALREPVSSYTSKQVSAEELLECIQEIGWREQLKPVYTPETFPWLMREAARKQAGDFRMVTVWNKEGVRSGWFVYYALRGGASFVLQIGVRSKEDFNDTLLALFRDAWEQGSVCVKGAAIPRYLTAMTDLYCIFRHPYDRVAIHSRHPEIANAVRTGEAAITRLDGIGWLRFPAERWN